MDLNGTHSIDDTQFGFTYSRLVHLIFEIRGKEEEEGKKTYFDS